MKLLVGLGNPGKTYEKNRHNVGMMFVDYYRKNIERTFNDVIIKDWKKIKNTLICSAENSKEKIILAKPQTFMNNSGASVADIKSYYKLDNDDICVVHDDLDIKLGEYKIQKGKGPKIHNGIVSIENALKNADFWRVRIGVDHRIPEKRIPGDIYVLQNFSLDETEILNKVYKTISDEQKIFS